MFQVQLVSHQTLPNAIGFLITRPKRVLLLTTSAPEIMIRAVRLQTFYRDEFGVTADVFEVGELGLYSHHLHQARNIMATVRAQGLDLSQIEINVTGGSKPLADAFKQAVIEHGGRAFYCHTDKKALEYYQPAKVISYRHGTPLEFEQLLFLQGYKLVESQCKRRFKQHVDSIATYFIHNRTVLTEALNAQLNNCALNALNSKELAVSIADHGFAKLLMQADVLNSVLAGLASVDIDNKSIHFCSANAAKFVAGQWLEEWVFEQAEQAGAAQVYLGAVVQDSTNSAIIQELDLVLMHNHQLMIVECKTSRPQYLQTKDVDRLVQLKRNLGLLTQVVFIALYGVEKNIEARLNREGITLIDGTHLNSLAAFFNDWVAQAQSMQVEPFLDALAQPTANGLLSAVKPWWQRFTQLLAR